MRNQHLLTGVTIKSSLQRLLLAPALFIGPLLRAQPGKPRLGSPLMRQCWRFIGTNSTALAKLTRVALSTGARGKSNFLSVWPWPWRQPYRASTRKGGRI